MDIVTRMVDVLNSIKDDEFIIGHHNRCLRFERFFYVTIRHLFLNDSARYDRILSTFYKNTEFTGYGNDLLLPLGNEFTLGDLRVLFPVNDDWDAVCEFENEVHKWDELYNGDFCLFIDGFNTSRDFVRFLDKILVLEGRRVFMRKLCYDLGLFYQEFNAHVFTRYLIDQGVIDSRLDNSYFTMLRMMADRTGLKRDELAELLCASYNVWM